MTLVCRPVLPDSKFVKRPKIFLKQTNWSLFWSVIKPTKALLEPRQMAIFTWNMSGRMKCVLKTSPKGFWASKCDEGNWILSKSLKKIEKCFGNVLDFLGSFWGIS
jgi:hypothetical protein